MNALCSEPAFSTVKRLRHISHYGGYVLAHQLEPSDWQATSRVFDLMDELELVPETFVDVGANESQWGSHVASRYPGINILSFEPNPDCHPIGRHFQLALSDTAGCGSLFDRGSMDVIKSECGHGTFQIARFDSLRDVSVGYPAALKICCDANTARALGGFGERIREFAIVVVEMWNHSPGMPGFGGQQAEIWEFMLENGFRGARAISTGFSTKGVPFYDMAFYRLQRPVEPSMRSIVPGNKDNQEQPMRMIEDAMFFVFIFIFWFVFLWVCQQVNIDI